MQYSRISERHRAWAGKLDLVIGEEHGAGEKLFTDGRFVGPFVNRVPTATVGDQSVRVDPIPLFQCRQRCGRWAGKDSSIATTAAV